jgi:mRNA interferase YafQ
MLTLKETGKFRKDVKRMVKRGKNLSLLDAVISTLLEEKPLSERQKDHRLKGELSGFRECHIENDWLLMYTVDKGSLVLTASRTGAHSDIFN